MQNNNTGWEIALIGTVLGDPTLMELAEDLAPQDFTGSNRALWRHMIALYKRGALEIRALVEALRSSDELSTLGADIGPDARAEEYLSFCHERRGGQIEEYVRQVGENATRRQLREAAALIAADCLNGRSSDELLDEAERRVMALRRARGTAGSSIAQVLQTFMPQLEGMRAGTIRPAFIPKLTALKNVIDYVADNDFVLIAGRPGDGKSSYLRFEAFWKGREGVPGLIFNLENAEVEYAKGFISLETGIDNRKLRDPRKLSVTELERVRQAAERLAQMPLEIMTLGSPSVAEVERIARAKMRTLKPKFIMLDYIQLVNNSNENKVQDITLTSQTMRAMAMQNRLNVPVICAAQLSREIERRGARSEPQLSDLRDSGSLEQDAKMVIFPRCTWYSPSPTEILRFPENRDPITGALFNEPRAVPIRMFVKKNTNGPIGISDEIKWCKHTGVYQTLQENRR